MANMDRRPISAVVPVHLIKQQTSGLQLGRRAHHNYLSLRCIVERMHCLLLCYSSVILQCCTVLLRKLLLILGLHRLNRRSRDGQRRRFMVSLSDLVVVVIELLYLVPNAQLMWVSVLHL